MDLAFIILKQTLTMMLYMLVGFLLFRTRKIDRDGSRAIATLLLWVVIPSTIINSFLVEFSIRRLKGFGISFLLGAIAVLTALGISWILFRKHPVDQFAASFSNAGFIGIPLTQAALGEEAVFFLVGMIVLLNLFQWTLGASMIRKSTGKCEKASLNAKEIFLNPVTIASVIGLLLFLTDSGTWLPGIFANCIKGAAALNAPLAMLVLGVYLAQTDIVSLVSAKRIYFTSVVRLLVIPVFTLLILLWLPVDEKVKYTILLACAAPAGANTAVYSQVYGGNYAYGCKIVTQSTILSVITMPLFFLFCQILR